MKGVFVKLIISGCMKLEDVPALWRAQVEEELLGASK